jgi:hypothetical protein
MIVTNKTTWRQSREKSNIKRIWIQKRRSRRVTTQSSRQISLARRIQMPMVEGRRRLKTKPKLRKRELKQEKKPKPKMSR